MKFFWKFPLSLHAGTSTIIPSRPSRAGGGTSSNVMGKQVVPHLHDDSASIGASNGDIEENFWPGHDVVKMLRY